MPLHRLTEAEARNARPHEDSKATPHPHVGRIKNHPSFGPIRIKRLRRRWTKMLCDGGGLYLQVSPGDGDDSIRKSWVFRYAMPEKVISKNGRQRQRERQLGLGPLRTVTLAEARDKAMSCRKLLLEGTDPLLALRLNRATNIKATMVMSFDAARDEYVKDQGDQWHPRHAQQFIKTLQDYVTPVFGKFPVSAVNEELVVRALRPIWKTKTVTASRVRGRIEAILDWAKVQKMRDGENPARWKGHLDHVFARETEIRPVKHMAALPFQDIPTFMATLREESALSAKAIQFQILTATRSGEVIQATWAEVDFDNRVWTIPAEQTKRKREHKVPLSDAAMTVLNNLKRSSERIFPISDATMMKFLKRGFPQLHITIHGTARSSFRDWAAETTDFSGEVCEAALAHSIRNRVEAAYRRGDLFEKRRRLMDAWAHYCAGQTEATGGNVIRFAAG